MKLAMQPVLFSSSLYRRSRCIPQCSVLVKRGADFNLDDYLKMRPDDLALKHGSGDAADLIRMHRRQRLEKVKESIEQVRLGFIYSY